MHGRHGAIFCRLSIVSLARNTARGPPSARDNEATAVDSGERLILKKEEGDEKKRGSGGGGEGGGYTLYMICKTARCTATVQRL